MSVEYVMEANVEEEHGLKSALKGLSLSHKQDKDMTDTAMRLSPKDYGHNKFLESIMIWVLVKAPRYWWQEADTFRISTKQSESTMHTLVKEVEQVVDWDTAFEAGDCVTEEQRHEIHKALRIQSPKEKLVRIKQLLPEGFLQQRMWCMSYKTLRNISIQRHYHRLIHWRVFLQSVYNQLQWAKFLPPLPEDMICGYDWKDNTISTKGSFSGN